MRVMTEKADIAKLHVGARPVWSCQHIRSMVLLLMWVLVLRMGVVTMLMPLDVSRVVGSVVRGMMRIQTTIIRSSRGCFVTRDRRHAAPSETGPTRTGSRMGEEADGVPGTESSSTNLVGRWRPSAAGTAPHARCGGSRQATCRQTSVRPSATDVERRAVATCSRSRRSLLSTIPTAAYAYAYAMADVADSTIPTTTTTVEARNRARRGVSPTGTRSHGVKVGAATRSTGTEKRRKRRDIFAALVLVLRTSSSPFLFDGICIGKGSRRRRRG